jgi:murein DD-endopeptidase MepM/ murein hydrolase activator NlpD
MASDPAKSSKAHRKTRLLYRLLKANPYAMRAFCNIFSAALLVFCFCSPLPIKAQEVSPPHYPRIKHLDRDDPLFEQLADDVATAHKAFAQSDDLPPLLFYLYTVKLDEDLYAVAARTNLGIDTIASVNGIDQPGDVTLGSELVLPNIPGVFASRDPKNDLERIVLTLRFPRIDDGLAVTIRSRESRAFYFFADETYHPVERAYFLGILFRFPLQEGSISSTYGMRTHPISGEDSLHTGIDIAAPQGTPVIAARGGKVQTKGYDAGGLGNFILLLHEGGMTTLYGHLSSILVNLNQEVNSGSLIGTVGTTGLSTGPHLHFEVRNEGELRDPMPLIHGKNE